CVTNFRKPPWYVERMPGGVGGGNREEPAYPISGLDNRRLRGFLRTLSLSHRHSRLVGKGETGAGAAAVPRGLRRRSSCRAVGRVGFWSRTADPREPAPFRSLNQYPFAGHGGVPSAGQG